MSVISNIVLKKGQLLPRSLASVIMSGLFTHDAPKEAALVEGWRAWVLES